MFNISTASNTVLKIANSDAIKKTDSGIIITKKLNFNVKNDVTNWEKIFTVYFTGAGLISLRTLRN